MKQAFIRWLLTAAAIVTVSACGGVKEKVTSAHRLGIKTIILPDHNQKDLEEIPDHIKKDLVFKFAKDMKDVIEIAIPEIKMGDEKKKETK